MICVTPLEKRTKRWKAIVAARGEAAAYSLYFKYKGEIPDSELEVVSEDQETLPKFKVIKAGVEELFESNPELANAVYEALGFNTVKDLSTLNIYNNIDISNAEKDEYKINIDNELYLDNSESKDSYFGYWMPIIYNGKDIGRVRFEEKINKINDTPVKTFNPNIQIYDAKMQEGQIDYTKKGIGTKVHIALYKYIKSIYPKRPFVSDVQNTIAEIGLLKSLEKKGVVTQINPIGKLSEKYNNYSTDEAPFIFNDDYFNSIKQITPQQKQEAQQLYSQYLDTVFPDSKVKDIVYHASNVDFTKNNFEKDWEGVFRGIFFYDKKSDVFGKQGYKYDNPAIINLINPEVGYEAVQKTFDKVTGEGAIQYNEKGIVQAVVFEPEQIHILGSKQDIEGFKEFVSTPENLPKFKPKPANTLSDLEVEQFRAALETSLQMGGTVNFNYWSESTSEQISEKSIEVLSIDDNSFTGRYPTGEERVFRYKNMISKAVPGKYEMHEQAYFKSNLEVGKTVDFNSNGLSYSGTIVDIGNEDFSIIDTAGDRYTIKYEDLDKENYQRKIFQRASEMKKLLEEQIERFSKTAKSEFQIERIALLQQALTHLDIYRGTADLLEFMKIMQTAVLKSRTLMKDLSESKELPESENEKITEINRRLSMISFLKDYVDSMMVFHQMSYDIYESDSSQELKEKAAVLGLEIKYAADTFYEVAIPNLADWLWMAFPKKLNSQLALVGEKELTKEDLIKELMQPRKDLDFFNSYGVPVANANDMITGLFSKAVKRMLQYAKELHLKLERDLLPYFKKVQDTGANMVEVYKKFYTIKEMETEEEVDVDGVLKVQPVKKNVRVFIEKYDLQKYYDTVRDYKAEIRALNEKIDASTSTNERNALISQRKKVSAKLNAYQKATAFNYSATEMNEMMEKLRKSNVPKFLDNLKYFYKIGPESENSFKVVTKDSVIYYNYQGNFYKPNQEAVDPQTGNKIFLTPEYENLMKEPQETIDLYNEMKRIYDEKNNMLPEHLRLNGVVPVVYEQSILRDVSKTLKNRNKYNDAQELRKKEKKTTTKLNGEPYQNVPLGYTRILDVNESSDNIMQSFLYWANDVQMYRAKSDVISSVEVLTKALENSKPLEEGETYRSRINRRAEVIKKYTNQVLYGETRAGNQWWDRVFDYMGKFTAVTRMFVKPASALNNLIIGNYATLSEAIGGRNFTLKELGRAHTKYVSMVVNEKQKLNNMILTLDAVQGRFKDEIGADFQTAKDTFGLNTAFSLNNLAEHQIQVVSMLALLDKWGVEIPEDGVFEVDKLPENFLGTLHELNKANNGVYSESDRLYHQDEALFRLFMQFRKYIVPTFRSRYSGMTQKGNNKYRMDFEAGSLELGYYRAFGEFVWENIIKIWNLPKIGENWKNLNEIEKEGFWRGTVDAVAFATISFMFLPLAGADDDDWDSDEHSNFENLIHWETIYQLARLRGDIGTYIPGFGFSDQSRLVNQPFAALSTLTQLAKIMRLTFDFEEDDEGNISIWKQYERDYGRYEKGDLKILQPISKLNPLDNPYEDLFPHVQYNDFKAASR
jgi:hypothetical protein